MTAPLPEDLSLRASVAEGGHLFFHGTAVALNGQGVLILGPSGSGKSSLALELMALGAILICDDGVWLRDGLLCRPDEAPELIEARGIGLLCAGPICQEAQLSLVVDLSRSEKDRLPARRTVSHNQTIVALILGAEQTTLASALNQFLRFGRADI